MNKGMFFLHFRTENRHMIFATFSGKKCAWQKTPALAVSFCRIAFFVRAGNFLFFHVNQAHIARTWRVQSNNKVTAGNCEQDEHENYACENVKSKLCTRAKKYFLTWGNSHNYLDDVPFHQPEASVWTSSIRLCHLSFCVCSRNFPFEVTVPIRSSFQVIKASLLHSFRQAPVHRQKLSDDFLLCEIRFRTLHWVFEMRVSSRMECFPANKW